MVGLIEAEVAKHVELKAVKEACLAEVERQKALQREFKALKKRRVVAVANVALWEERNFKLSKQVDAYVDRERKKIRNLIIAESSAPKKVLRT
jgi:hypothetical protein